MTSNFATELTAFAHRYPHPDTRPAGSSWNQGCALLMARLGLAPQPIGWAVPPHSYGDAGPMAADTARIAPLNPNSKLAPIGALHWWLIAGSVYHVGVDANGGGTQIFMATGELENVLERYIGYSSEAFYSAFAKKQGGHYLGWSKSYNGGLYKLPVEPAPATVSLAPNQRRAGAAGVNARASYTTASAIVASAGIAPNAAGTFDGYVTGTSVTVGKVTSTTWYVKGKYYYSAAAFETAPSTSGLTDLTPNPTTPVPPTTVPTPVDTAPAAPSTPTDPVAPSTPAAPATGQQVSSTRPPTGATTDPVAGTTPGAEDGATDTTPPPADPSTNAPGATSPAAASGKAPSAGLVGLIGTGVLVLIAAIAAIFHIHL